MITPIDTFISKIIITTGSIIIDALRNIEPEAAIPLSINADGLGVAQLVLSDNFRSVFLMLKDVRQTSEKS